MGGYKLTIQPSATKELQAITDKANLARLIERIKSLSAQPRPSGSKSSRADRISIASVKVTIASSTPLMISHVSPTLKPDGHLILLWNKEPQPSAAIQAALSEVYQRHAPALGHTEDRATQESILSGLGQMMLDSGRFHNLVAATLECSLTTTPDQYIDLLGTYSPYHKLDPQVRSALFSELKQCLVQQGVGELQLSYLSAVHITQRMPSFGQ